MFANCAYQKLQAVLDEPQAGAQQKLPVSITRLAVVDARAHADERSLKIPGLPLSARSDEVAPALSDEQKNMIERHIAGSVEADGAYKAACSVQVVEGVEKYKGSWLSEDMFVKSKIRVVLHDSLHTPFLASAEGETEYSFQSNIANTKNFEKLYKKAMKTALAKALESIGGVLKTMEPKR
jgi:hypothetical protein